MNYIKFLEKKYGKNEFEGSVVKYPRGSGVVACNPTDKSGIYFANLVDAFSFTEYGDWFRFVTPLSKVHEQPHADEGPEKEYWANEVEVSKAYKLSYAEILNLIDAGADIKTANNGGSLIYYMVKNRYDPKQIDNIMSLGCTVKELSLYPLFAVAYPEDTWLYDDSYTKDVLSVMSKYIDIDEYLASLQKILLHLFEVFKNIIHHNIEVTVMDENNRVHNKVNTEKYSPNMNAFMLTHVDCGVHPGEHVIRDREGFIKVLRKGNSDVRKTK